MKADPFVQERLLELPVIDQKLAQLAKELRSSALKEEATNARAAVVKAEEAAVAARTLLKDLEREIARAEQDVQTVRSRVERDQRALESGGVSAKQAQDLQHELQSLARRQTDLEDIEIEIMERCEQAGSDAQEAQTAFENAQHHADEAVAAWDRREDEIAAETVALQERRAQVCAEIPADLVAVYDKIRERSGQGAGLVRHGRCGACQLMLSSSDLDRIRQAASDEVVRCEECGAIMIRTEESGL